MDGQQFKFYFRIISSFFHGYGHGLKKKEHIYPTDSSNIDNGSKVHLSTPVTYVILYINSISIKKNLKIT